MTDQDCIVLYLPLFHVYGAFATIINCTVSGARVVLMDTYDVGESLRLMARSERPLPMAWTQCSTTSCATRFRAYRSQLASYRCLPKWRPQPCSAHQRHHRPHV